MHLDVKHMGALHARWTTAEMISFYMPSNDPVVLQKVSLMKHIQMEKYHAIYDKHAAVLFQNGSWLQRASLRAMTDMLRNTTSITCHNPNKGIEAQGNLNLRIHNVTLMLNIIFWRESKW